MRLATIVEDGDASVVVISNDRFVELELPHAWRPTMRELAAFSSDELRAVGDWVDQQTPAAWRSLDGIELGPAVTEPGAIYTVGLNYDGPGAAPRPERPLVYGKAPTSVAAHGATLTWDRALTPNVDAEVELGVVVGVADSVFGYTIIDDVSSRDPWLDGDQWLLGKSMPGFCPVGPWVVTADELDATDVRLGCTIKGEPIQDGRTSDMRFSILEVIAYLSRHIRLEPGDLIATGTPARLATPPGPDRHLKPGDAVTAWIEGIGELSTYIA
jgi:2-keto-4-pentenoate hydratase/2-oxohepta-3-ene-1,7-dioic acid hydratase in catechol pathway